MPPITILAALAENRVIGVRNEMPWHIREESAHVFRTTRRGTLVMGRKTFDSLGGKPLPGRPHLIVSRSLPPGPADLDGVEVFPSLESALGRAREIGREVFIFGGAQIYALALPLADRMILSYIKGAYPGDAFFPAFDEASWGVVSRDERERFTVVEYRRKPPNSGL